MNTFGLSPEQYEILKTHLIDKLKEKGYSLWVFGSRARGDHHPYSDIDILYKSPSTAQDSTFLGEIQEQLENSNLTIKVDLVSTDNLVDSYQPSVERDKKEI
jgi:predicted nucleotidyltransferase